MIRAKVNRRKTWYSLIGLTSVVWLPLYLIYTGLAVFGDAVTHQLDIQFKGLDETEEEVEVGSIDE